MRALLLGRVSTEEQRRDDSGRVVKVAQDPANQLEPLREAARRLGWEVAEEVALPGLSAWDPKEASEVQRRILAPFEKGRADVLMVWSLDRVTRGGIAEAFAFLRRLEKDLGVGFWSLKEPFLNTTTDPQQRELMVALLSWVARWESERRSARVRAKAIAKRANSASLGQRARWGRGSIPSATDVEEILRLRASGVSMASIGKKLGLATSTVHRYVSFERTHSNESTPLPEATAQTMGEDSNG